MITLFLQLLEIALYTAIVNLELLMMARIIVSHVAYSVLLAILQLATVPNVMIPHLKFIKQISQLVFGISHPSSKRLVLVSAGVHHTTTYLV